MLYFDFYFLFSFVVNNTEKDVNHHNTKDQKGKKDNSGRAQMEWYK